MTKRLAEGETARWREEANDRELLKGDGCMQ